MPTAPAPKIKIVLVEDDKFLQKILMTKFMKEGFDARAASDGEDGLKLIFSDRPDIILLDLILPKMTGYDVLTELKANPKTAGIPVVILSNLAQEEDVSRAKSLGAVEFLVKADISINNVVAKVKEVYVRDRQVAK